jgi:hypothetical protein
MVPASIPAQVAVSSQHAGARPVTVSVQVRYEMQCGWPGPGVVTIRFPAGMAVPASIPASAVLVQGKPATRATSQGRTETVSLPPRHGMLCDSIGPGRLTIGFTPAARLGNPHVPGSYVLRVTKGASSFEGRFAVRG